MKVLFVGINGFDLAYTRVRCYNFAGLLQSCGCRTGVFTFQEEYFPGSEPDYTLNLKDPVKVRLTMSALKRLWPEKKTLFYVQKAHYHAAAPFLLSRFGRNRYILDYDDWDLDRSPFFDSDIINRMVFKGTGSAGITANLALRAAACVVSTEPLRELLMKYNDRVFIVPTVADTDRFKPEPGSRKGGKVTFVWTGMVWGRVMFDNVMFVVDCFRFVHESCRDTELLIAGQGWWFGRMKEEIEKKYEGLPVVVRDWVPPDDMPSFLHQADVGLLPLLPDSKNEDWMRCKCPTKLFEFMAMAMPTVSSDFGEVRRVIRDGEDGFLAGDKVAFIEKMKLLATDRNLRERVGARAREVAVARYSLNAQRGPLCDIVRAAAK